MIQQRRLQRIKPSYSVFVTSPKISLEPFLVRLLSVLVALDLPPTPQCHTVVFSQPFYASLPSPYQSLANPTIQFSKLIESPQRFTTP